MTFLNVYFQAWKSNNKKIKNKHFWKSNANLLYSNVNLHGIYIRYALEFSLLVKILHSPFFKYTQSFHKMFNHGNLV